MRWILVGLGVAAVAVLLNWMQDDGDAARGQRDVAQVPVSSADVGESGEKEREEEGELVTLRGMVVNEDDEPVVGARVEVRRGEGVEPDSTLSDAEGRFGLDVPTQSFFAAVVRHPDYVAGVAYYQAPDFGSERRVVLARGAKYGIRVIDPDRKPVAGATVSAAVQEQRGVPGIWGWSNEHELEGGKTGTDGIFPLGALPLGTVLLRVECEGFAVHRETLEVVNEEAVDHVVMLNRGGAIEGRVLGPGDEPVAGARVFTDDREARSDETGHYRIERVGAGPATVRAERDGLAPGFFGAEIGWDDPVPVQVVVGETMLEVDIRLGEATWIVGRIVDEKGSPVPDAQISAPVWGAFVLTDDFRSDAEGRFEAGPYHVTEPSPLHLYIQKEGFVTLQPKPRAVKAGERVDVGDLKLAASPPLVGRVVDENGEPVAGASVTAQPGWNTAETDAEGRFSVRVPRAVKLTVSATGSASRPGRSRHVLVDARPGQPREEIVLALYPPLSIRGNVTDGQGNPRARVTLIARSAEVPAGAQGSTAVWATTDANGTYDMTPLVPGRYRIGVVGFSGNYYWDDADWTADPGPVEADAGDTGVDFVYPFTGGIVTAKVVSKRTGRPIRDIRFGLIRYRMLLPTFSTAGEIESPDGSFRTEFKQEGSWAIEFQADGHASYRTPRMDLEKGEVKDLGTIRLGEGGTLVGIVKDAQGRPVPYTRVNILSPKFETNENEPFTGRDGRFRIPMISPGLYNVFAVSPQHPIAFVRNVTLREAETTEVEVKFERPAPLEIRVRDENGSPIEDASLSFTFPAIAPLSSKLFRNKIPPGYGSHKSDAEGRLVQHSLPAGPVTLTIEAQGFTPVTRQLELTAGETTQLEIRLAPKK